MDREKVIKGLECCYASFPKLKGCPVCPYVKICYHDKACDELLSDALALLKDKTTCTNNSRIFHCEKCGYGIDDIFLSDEHNYQIEPRFCPNCGRSVEWE